MRLASLSPLAVLFSLTLPLLGQQSGDFTYSSSGGAVTIVKYTGAGGAVTVPGTIAGQPVRTIGVDAFRVGTVTSVQLPSSLVTIADQAFYECSGLTSITLPNSVTSIGRLSFGSCSNLATVTLSSNLTTVGEGAFQFCSKLTSITLPNGITSLPQFVFNGCSALTSITLPSNLTTLGRGVFQDCSKLTSITLPNSVTSIGMQVFFRCTSLTRITLSSSLTTIGNATFGYCSGLAHVTFPASLTTLGEYVFSEATSLKTATFLGNAPANMGPGVFNAVSSDFTVYYLGGKTGYATPQWRGYPALPIDFTYTIASGAATITGYTGAGGAVTVPPTIEGNPVTSLGPESFHSKQAITSISLPDSVTYVGWGAFANCKGLTSIHLGSGVTMIDHNAFYDCVSLKGITIPASVNHIGVSTFRNTGLNSALFLGNAPATFGDIVFANTAPGFTIYYYGTPTGFTSPTWKGYPAVNLISPKPMHAWRMAHFGIPADTGIAGNNADPDGDGVPNLLEYAFNLDPRATGPNTLTPGTGTRGLPSVTVIRQPNASPIIRVEYLRRKGTGIRYTPQCSGDLRQNSWSTIGGTENVTSIDANWERVIVNDAPLNQARHFGRVKVEELPN